MSHEWTALFLFFKFAKGQRNFQLFLTISQYGEVIARFLTVFRNN